MATPNENFRGAALMSAAMAGYVLNDMVMKLVSTDLALFQSIFLRGLFATTLIGFLAWRQRALIFNPISSDRKILGWRIIGEIGATVCFLTALFNMPIANATAILQALPLAVTLGAAVFLGEPVGWRRYLAIFIGFAGVMVIVRPGSEGFNEYSLWAIGAVAFVVLRDLATRRLSEEVPSLFVAFLASLAIMLVSAAALPFSDWRPVSIQNVGMLGLAALFIFVAYLFSVMTMRVGDVGFISPFRYTILVWAIIIGIIVFDELPDFWTVVGGTVVITMGVYTFYRERQLAEHENPFD